jgi:hypothetical protein
MQVLCSSRAWARTGWRASAARPLRQAALFVLLGLAAADLRADIPPLLARAIERWDEGKGELAFTQETKRYRADGELRDDRTERFDPSLPDSRRWTLLTVNGVPASERQRDSWEARKNGRPRRKVVETPARYLDLEHAVRVSETPTIVRFRVPLLPNAQHLVDVAGVAVVITVDKQTGNVSRVGAVLRQAVHTLFGLAEITDLDVDLHLDPDSEPADSRDEVLPGSSARVKLSELGRPVEYDWTEFKRVTSSPSP